MIFRLIYLNLNLNVVGSQAEKKQDSTEELRHLDDYRILFSVEARISMDQLGSNNYSSIIQNPQGHHTLWQV